MAGSNTGKAPQLCDYYSYWEMAVFNALVLMVLKGLEKLHSMLTKKPLFKVVAARSSVSHQIAFCTVLYVVERSAHFANSTCLDGQAC